MASSQCGIDVARKRYEVDRETKSQPMCRRMMCCLLCSSEGHREPDRLDSVLHQDLLMLVDESCRHSSDRRTALVMFRA
jgi:hypothetical protein